MKTKIITRPFSVKETAEDGTFSGYGSVFHVEDDYRDVVSPGAFSASLADWRAKGRMPALLWQHDSGKPIGVFEEMSEDEHGLFVKGKLLKDDVAMAGEAHALMRAGALSGLSIGYRTIVDEFNRETGVTTLKEVDLWEVSVVTFPANDLARVDNVKSIKTVVDLERYLREAGNLSRTEAKQIIHDVKESMREACAIEEMTQTISKNIQLLGG